MKISSKILVGDSRKILSALPSESVHLIITSPPYWNIKDYGHSNQIGFGQSYEEYISDLNKIWEESKRILYPGCKLVINVGDQFIRAKDNNGIFEIKPIHKDIIDGCQSLDFIFLGNIIWKKISNTKTSGGCCWMGSIYYPRDGYITYEHEYIIIFKKDGKAPKPSKENKEKSRLTKEQRSEWFRGIWEIRPQKQKDHCAQFPIELPHRIIKMFSFYGETVLDPFVGSGTTSLAAKNNGRNSIGIELNEEFIPIIKNKIGNVEIT